MEKQIKIIKKWEVAFDKDQTETHAIVEVSVGDHSAQQELILPTDKNKQKDLLDKYLEEYAKEYVTE